MESYVPTPLEVVRALYDASAARDLEALRATLANDVVWTEMAGFPLGGTYYGPYGVTSHVMEQLAAEWDGWTVAPDEFIAQDERVIALCRYTARNKATGKPLNVRVAHAFTVLHGKITMFEQFTDTALVREAMTF